MIKIKLIKIIVLIGLMLFCALIPVLAQVPSDAGISTTTSIANEHKATRKFFSDELTRQRTEFFKMMDGRADYYETTADNLLRDAVWKLGMIWFGVVLFVTGFNNFLNRKLEKRRYNKMKDALTKEIKADVLKDSKKKQIEIELKSEKLSVQQQVLAKAKPQLIEMQQRMAKEQAQIKNLMDNMVKTPE